VSSTAKEPDEVARAVEPGACSNNPKHRYMGSRMKQQARSDNCTIESLWSSNRKTGHAVLIGTSRQSSMRP